MRKEMWEESAHQCPMYCDSRCSIQWSDEMGEHHRCDTDCPVLFWLEKFYIKLIKEGV